LGKTEAEISGLVFSPTWITAARRIRLGQYYSPPNATQTQGYLLMNQLLLDGDAPTAVVTGSDVLPAGALQAIYEHGLRVPEDISVVGFDDSFASFLTPPLATIAQPVRALGEGAIELAVKPADDLDEAQQTRLYQARLVIRKSTGPCRS
jgi:LacI family transcriptional regulator